MWIKSSGTGNTGWEVVTGDTGWVPLVAWNTSGTITAGTRPEGIQITTPNWRGGGIWFRRAGTMIHFRAAACVMSSSAWIPIPTWARPEISAPWWTTPLTSGSYNSPVMVRLEQGALSAATEVRFHDSWGAAAEWPVHPGTAWPATL